MSRLVELRQQLEKLSADMQAHLKIENPTAEDTQRGANMYDDFIAKEEEYKKLLDIDNAAKRAEAFLNEPATRSAAGLVPNGGNELIEARGDVTPLGFDTRAFEQTVEDYRKRSGNGSNNAKSEAFDYSLNMDQRALVYTGAFPASMKPAQVLPGIQRPNEPIGGRAVRQVLLGGTTTQNSITFAKENVFTNAAAMVAEAVSTVTGAKPESSLTFTEVTVSLGNAAHWIPVSRQALDDVAQLRSYIEGRLIDGLIREENDQLLNGDGTSPNLSGLLDQSGIQVLDQTYFTGAPVNTASGLGSAEMFNRILRAKTLIMTTGDSSATFTIVNPTDYESLLTAADTTENYFGAGPFSTGTNPRIWGLEVVQTEAMTAGNYLVGDGTAAQVWDRQSIQIFMADQHDDFFIRNLFVLLAEERLGLTVYRPAAFALVDVPA